MTSFTTTQNPELIRQEIYSQFLLTVLTPDILPGVFYRNVSDFMDGDQLNIPTLGSTTLQEVSEDSPLTYTGLETGRVQLQITDYVGDAYYLTKKLRQDGYVVDAAVAQKAMETAKAIARDFEGGLWQVLYDAQTDADPNNFNGTAHRIVGSGTNEAIAIGDITKVALAFDKANVSQGARVGIVTPEVAHTMWNKFQGTYNVNSNPTLQSILETGFAKDHKFVMNINGIEIYTSNLLPDVVAGAGDGTATLGAAGKANVFMSVADDNEKPGMMAWRQQPETDQEYNKDLQRWEWVTTARWGKGVQREDTLAVILTRDGALG